MQMTLTRGKSFDGEFLSAGVLFVAGVLGVFAWLTPNHYIPWLSFHGELSMGVAMFLACGWVFWSRRGTPLLVPYLSAVSFAAVFLPALQLALGLLVFAGDAWLGALYLLGFALSQLAGFRAASAWGIDRAVEVVQWILLLSAVASVGIALYQWQGLDFLGSAVIDITKGMRPYGNVIQPNNLATLLVLGLIATAYFYERRRIGAVASVFLVLVLGFGIALTQSRAGLLETVVIGAVLLLRRKAVLNGRLRWVAALIGLASIWIIFALWLGAQKMQPTPEGRPTSEIVQVGKRTIHWLSLVDAIERKPWLGYGWNQVGAAQYAVAVDHPASEETISESHDLVLDLLVWNGLPVGVLLIVALAAWFWAALRNIRDPSTLLTYCSVAAVFAHSMVEFPLYYSNFLLPVGWFMGAVSAVALPRATFSWPRWVAPASVTVAFAAMVAMSLEYFKLESDLRLLRFQQMHIGPGYHAEPSPMVVLTQLGHFWNFVITPEHRGMSPAELDDMREVTERFSSKDNIVRYAAALALNGRGDEAAQALRRICKMNPETACDSMKSLWRGLGRRDPEIAKIPWPAD